MGVGLAKEGAAEDPHHNWWEGVLARELDRHGFQSNAFGLCDLEQVNLSELNFTSASEDKDSTDLFKVLVR